MINHLAFRLNLVVQVPTQVQVIMGVVPLARPLFVVTGLPTCKYSVNNIAKYDVDI